MKTCSRCMEEKSLDLFGNNKTRPDGKQRYCKLCAKKSNAAHYKKDPVKRRSLTLETKRISQQYIWDYLKCHPCIDCLDDDPIVLQFDHVRGEKKFNISEGPHKGYSLPKILDEMLKCDVRCANCHVRQTALRGGWYKNLDVA